jgi:hypothetical protein
MKTLTAPIRFARSRLGGVRHVCELLNSAKEEYRVRTNAWSFPSDAL